MSTVHARLSMSRSDDLDTVLALNGNQEPYRVVGRYARPNGIHHPGHSIRLSFLDTRLNNFYVYLHTRNDTGEVFYVGKGRGYRAYRFSGRNNLWDKIIAKTGYSISFYAKDLSEEMAFQLEIEAVAFYRAKTKTFANFTNGGEGMSGFIVTEETRAKLRARHFFHTDNAKRKMSESRRGEKATWYGKHLSEEHKKKISEKRKGMSPSAETRMKTSISLRGKKRTEEQKLQYSKSSSGSKNARYDHRIFHFYHSIYGHEICTKWQLRMKYNLISSSVSKMVAGKFKQINGWSLI